MSQSCHIGLLLACFGAEVPGMAYRSFNEVIEEFWGPCYQHFRGGVCEINQHAAS
jgi:hypothetical protein